MPSLHMLLVAARRLLARRPWIYWLVVIAAALSTAAAVRQRVAAVDEARQSWGDTRPVVVARHDTPAGELLDVELRELPLAMIPVAALTDPTDAPLTARQDVVAGEIVTTSDVARHGAEGPEALLPDGWAAVPIVEAPPLAAAIGARVQVAGDGVLLAPDAVVVGYHDDVTLIAVPVAVAPMVAAGAAAGGVAVLLLP